MCPYGLGEETVRHLVADCSQPDEARDASRRDTGLPEMCAKHSPTQTMLIISSDGCCGYEDY